MLTTIASSDLTSVDADDYEAVEDPIFDVDPIAPSDLASIDADDYEAVEDPIFDTPSPVFTFFDTKIANHSDFNYRSTASFQSRTYDLYELSQKSDLSYEELSYIFAFSQRQEKFRGLVDPDLFTALLKKKSLVKKAKLIVKEATPSLPKYDIAELAKKTILSKEETDWILRDASKRDILRELAPELLYAIQGTKKPYPDKDNNGLISEVISDDPIIPAAKNYDLAELAKKTIHTKEEIDSVLNCRKRKKVFKEIAPELLASFYMENSPKYDIAELAKKITLSQEEADWVLNNPKRKQALNELAPHLIASFIKPQTLTPPKYDITELAKRTTLNRKEIDWLRNNPKRKQALNELAPHLIASFIKPQTPPKYDITELAKRTTLTQEEINWLLKNPKRKQALNELAPQLNCVFERL